MIHVLLFVLCFVGHDNLIDDHADPDSVKAELIRYLEEDDFDKTVGFAEAAVEFYRSRNNLMDMAGCFMTLGNAYQRMGQYEEAIRNYNLCSETMARWPRSTSATFSTHGCDVPRNGGIRPG